jgi:hypothetical protein
LVSYGTPPPVCRFHRVIAVANSAADGFTTTRLNCEFRYILLPLVASQRMCSRLAVTSKWPVTVIPVPPLPIR